MFNKMIALLVLIGAGCDAENPYSYDDNLSTDLYETTYASSPWDGTPEALAAIHFLNAETTTFTVLDQNVPLDRRAATQIILERDGLDAVFGTNDDTVFDSLAQVEEIRWVGPSSIERIINFAADAGWAADEDEVLGSWDGVSFTVEEASQTLDVANHSSFAFLDDTLGLDERAVRSIVDARPIHSVSELAGLYYVGGVALDILKNTPGPGGVSPEEVFHQDLSDALEQRYGDLTEGVPVSETYSLEAALSMVHVKNIYLVSGPEADLVEYNPNTTVLYAHPDTIFKNRDAVWLGAYRRDTGELLDLHFLE
jgi:hypothetical protein